MKFAFASIAAMGMLATALSALPPSAAASQDQRQYNNDQQRQSNTHPDYSKNKYYTLGNREGYQDYGRKKQRETHNHNFKRDEDRAAHDYGYQQGWQGQRGYQSDDKNRR